MDEKLISSMRDRIQRTRRVIELAHDPEMIALLEQMIEEAEADIRRMEDEHPPATIEIERDCGAD